MDGGTDYSNKQTDTPTTDCEVRSPVTGYDYWLNDDDENIDNDDTCFLPPSLPTHLQAAAVPAATWAPTATRGARRRSLFGFRPTREGGGGGGGTN